MSFPRSSYTGFPSNTESVRDEFPFTRGASRDADLQSTLDKIAQRHPDIAEHLTNFNQTSRPRSRQTDEFRERFRRPFRDHSGFPFDDDDDDDIYLDPHTKQFCDPQVFHNRNYFPQTSSHQEQHKQQNPQPSHPEHSEPSPFQAAENTQTPKREGNSNIHQSNTIDLGQKQEPFDDRNQRSMSAPPGGDNKKRFTSSINIPINTPPAPSENMSHNQQQESKTNERIIPIQVEGRDNPIIPKNPHIPQSNQSQSRPDRIFGQSPEQFTQFVTPNAFGRQGFADDQFDGHYSKEDAPVPMQREAPKTQPNQTRQEEESKHEPKVSQERPKPATPIEQIQMIQKDVSKLMEDVAKFSGKSKDKRYLYLDEMLTRNLLKLDDIDTQGQENIRASRKEAIKCIQEAISLLENKAAMNSAKAEAEQVSEKADEESESQKKAETENMETESTKESSEKMDVAENVDNNKVLESQPNLENRAVLVVEPQSSKGEENKPNDPENTNSNDLKEKKEKKKGH